MLLVIAICVLVPVFALRAINNELGSLPHFEGHAEDLSLRPFRRTIVLHELRLDPRGIDREVDLLRIDDVEIQVGWRGWWPRTWKLKIAVRGLKVDVLVSQLPDVLEAIKKSDFIGQFLQAPPLTVRRLSLEDSALHVRFFEVESPMQVYVTRRNGQVRNLSNRRDLQGKGPTTVKLKGMVQGRSALRLEAEGNAFAAPYDCEGSFKLAPLALAPLAPLIAETADIVEVVGGDLSTHTTAVCRDDHADVHVRVQLRDLTFADPDEENALLERMRTTVVAGALEHGAKLKGHIATTHFQTRVPYDDPEDVQTGRIIIEALNNFSTEPLSEPLPKANTESSAND